MLPSLKFFGKDNCPYFKAGLCERPHCPFRHASTLARRGSEFPPVTTSDEVDYPMPNSKIQIYENTDDTLDNTHKSKRIKLELGADSTDIKAKKSPSIEIENEPSTDVASKNGKEINTKDIKLLDEKTQLEDEYENMLLGSDDDDEDFSIDSEMAEQFLLPEDTGSEDPAELVDACYKEWLRAKQELPKSSECENMVKSNDESMMQLLQPSISQANSKSENRISPNKRLAHRPDNPSSSNIKLNPKKVTKPTPAETLLRRFEEIRKSKPNTADDDDRRKQKHKPNSVQPKPNSATVSQTNEKGSSRKAHVPVLEVRRIPLIGRDSIAASKIPLITRQHTLEQLFKACEQIYDNNEEASQRAVEEELALAAKHKSKPVYVGSSANCLKRLRDEASKTQQTIKTLQSRPDAKTENGKTIKISPALLEKRSLYQAIKKYILTPEELTDNGFPRIHPNGDRGRITTKSRKTKAPYNGDPTTRVCDRCHKQFIVALDGAPCVKEVCIYHHGRNFKRRVQGNYEGRYTCCDGESNSRGCTVANLHVSVHPSDEIYGFVASVKELGDDDTMGDNPWDIVALDCEMVYTTYGNELARATFVSVDKKILYDKLVKPIHPIIDYNTRFSGITDEMMKDITTTLTDVQAVMLTLIRPNTILIGHSLESDLMALKIKHDCVVDTSVMFPHRLGLPYKRALRTLATDCLGKIIQTGEHGHNSEEDAMTALELVLWKIKRDVAPS